MLNAPDALFLNSKALVLRRSMSMTASDTLVSGIHPYVGGKFALTVILAALALRTWRGERTLRSDELHSARDLGDPLAPGPDVVH